MFSTTATESVETVPQTNITWIENLTIGLSYLLVHPFIPFLRSNFNYQCLFMRKSHCPSEVSSPSKILNGYISDLAHRTQEVHFKNLAKSLIPDALRPMFQTQQTKSFLRPGIESWVQPLRYLIERKSQIWPNFLMLVQLMICTVGLSYFLYHDLRIIIDRVNLMRRKFANKLMV